MCTYGEVCSNWEILASTLVIIYLAVGFFIGILFSLAAGRGKTSWLQFCILLALCTTLAPLVVIAAYCYRKWKFR
jgi:membrane protein YdbS with pleckstrin-like domain